MGLDIPALRILRETIRIYQDCQTYTDQGQATVFSYDERHRPRREMLFATAFRRPDHLRFDLRALPSPQAPEPPPALPSRAQPAQDAVVCWRGAGVETWLDDEPAPVESVTIESVLAEVSDLPTAAAGYIAHLLLCDDADFAQEHRVRYHGLRSLEAGECHKLTIPTGPSGPAGAAGQAADGSNAMTLWIDSGSHLIRRLLEVHRPENHRRPARPIQTILRFEPTLDAAVGLELFDYEPPAEPPRARGGSDDLGPRA